MARPESTDFSTKPILPKGCKDCNKTFLSDFNGTKYCVNCNPHLTGVKRTRVLLTEQQLMDVLDLQWAMMEYNTSKANQIEAAEIEQDRLRVEEIRKRVWEKYNKAVIGETNPTTATGVHVG